MSKRMKIARYTAAIIASLLFVVYILKLFGVGFFASLGSWVTFAFWAFTALNMILILVTQNRAKNSQNK